jgi:hypothetical protein
VADPRAGGNLVEVALQRMTGGEIYGVTVAVVGLAPEDPRVRAVHVTFLPPGWLGRLHALHEALRLATGTWLLFSDADVHLALSEAGWRGHVGGAGFHC